MKPWIPFALSMTLLTACQSPSEPPLDSEWSEPLPSVTIPTLQREGVTWSHLVDDASRQQLRKTMNRAGLSEASQQFFWDDVDRSLDYIDSSQLVTSGFEPIDERATRLDEAFDVERWEKEQGVFIGYNCRITAFGLMRDVLDIPTNVEARSRELFMDNDALDESPDAPFTKEERAQFEQLFSYVPTTPSKNVDEKVREVQDALHERGIAFPDEHVSIGTVWLHAINEDEEGKEDHYLFVGHTGLIFEEDDGHILLLEKLSFQEPYQLVRFPNRQALSDYWMYKYDTNVGQPMAKPFILENDQPIEGYRPSLDNPTDA